MSRPNNRKLYHLNSVLTFGLHKGLTISEIINKNPGWLHWAIENIEGFELSNKAFERLPFPEDNPDLGARETLSWGDFHT